MDNDEQLEESVAFLKRMEKDVKENGLFQMINLRPLLERSLFYDISKFNLKIKYWRLTLKIFYDEIEKESFIEKNIEKSQSAKKEHLEIFEIPLKDLSKYRVLNYYNTDLLFKIKKVKNEVKYIIYGLIKELDEDLTIVCCKGNPLFDFMDLLEANLYVKIKNLWIHCRQVARFSERHIYTYHIENLNIDTHLVMNMNYTCLSHKKDSYINEMLNNFETSVHDFILDINEKPVGKICFIKINNETYRIPFIEPKVFELMDQGENLSYDLIQFIESFKFENIILDNLNDESQKDFFNRLGINQLETKEIIKIYDINGLNNLLNLTELDLKELYNINFKV